jgi:hypothetical protein
VSRLRAWLAGATHRRVVVDPVYLLENVFSSEMVDLIETGQAIVLHSLSKGWLRPQIFGVALLPEDDVQPLTPTFRAEPAERDALREAWALLTVHDDMPGKVTGVLLRADERLRELLNRERGFRLEPMHTVGARYHFIVPTPWRTLLKRVRTAHAAILSVWWA